MKEIMTEKGMRKNWEKIEKKLRKNWEKTDTDTRNEQQLGTELSKRPRQDWETTPTRSGEGYINNLETWMK